MQRQTSAGATTGMGNAGRWTLLSIGLATVGAFSFAIAWSWSSESRDLPAFLPVAPAVRAAAAAVDLVRRHLPGLPAASFPIEAGLALAVLGVLWRRSATASESGRPARGPFTTAEVVLYLALLATTLALRFFAVNFLPSEWRGETWYHVAASSDLETMSRLALRVESPVISQGLVWYGLEHVWTALFGPTFAAGRLLQATVSAALVPVLYGFLRRFAGPRAALLGAALAAFGPLELAWGRSEYLYPYVEVYAVALAWAAYEAGESPRPAALAAVCAGMAVGGLVYPAARLLPILPLLYLPLRWRQNPSRTVSRLPCGLWLAAGCTGFLVLPNILRKVVSGSFGAIDPLSIDPNLGIVVRTGSGAAAAPTAGLATALLDSSLALARNLLLECRDSWFSEVSSLEPKTLLSPFAATFVLAGLLLAFRRRRPCDVLLLAWIALALPPALLSDNPEARRMAAAFPAFFSLAALTARDSLDAVTPDRAARRARLAGFALFAAVLLAEGVVRAGLYFEKPLGRPRASIVARGLRPFLGPGTLLVVDLNRRYRDFFEGKLYLELVDVLRTKEGGPLWAAPGEKRIASFIDAPRPEPAGPFQSISPSRADAWSRIVFVFRDVPETGEKLARVTRRHPGTTIIHRQFGADAEYMAVVIAQSPRIAAEPAPTPLRSSGP